MTLNRRQIVKLGTAGALMSLLKPALGDSLTSSKMPAVFIGHGSPMNAIQDNAYSRQWKSIAASFEKPKAIVVLSAHWLTRGGVFAMVNPRPEVIYDMRGFPESLYQVKYPAPGAPKLAEEIGQLLGQSVPTQLTDQWGLDHGTWSVLVHMYPQADIPVIQLSLDYAMAPQQHLALAQKLGYLRERGVLVLGSGNLVHNLRLVGRQKTPFDWAEEFGQRMTKAINERDFTQVADFQSLGKLATLAHPTYEHLLPLFYTLGVINNNDELRWFTQQIEYGTLDMSCLMVS